MPGRALQTSHVGLCTTDLAPGVQMGVEGSHGPLGRQDHSWTTARYMVEPGFAVCLQGHRRECLRRPRVGGTAGDDPSRTVAGRLEPGSQAI